MFGDHRKLCLFCHLKTGIKMKKKEFQAKFLLRLYFIIKHFSKNHSILSRRHGFPHFYKIHKIQQVVIIRE